MTTRTREGQPGRGGIGGAVGSPRPAGKSARAAADGDAHAPAGFDSRPAPPSDSPHDVDALLAHLDRRLALEASAPTPACPQGYRLDGKGRMVPERLVRPAEELEDACVRRIAAFGVDLADQIARYRAHVHDDVGALLEILASDYGAARKAGARGNLSLTSYDGRIRVTVQAADRVSWGPELQVARQLIDECLAEWSDGSRDEVRALLQGALVPDREGHISREAVWRLRRIDIDDDRWRQVRRALDDAIRVVGRKVYVRLHVRGSTEDRWRAVPIDIAGDWADTTELSARAISPATEAGDTV